MATVKVKPGELFEHALASFIRKCREERIIQEIKARQSYMSKGTKLRSEQAARKKKADRKKLKK